MPPVTTALIGANIAVFLLQQLAPDLVGMFALWPLDTAQVASDVAFEPWQILTYGFLHGGTLHLAFNMLAVGMFGGPLERVLGSRRYLVYYLACVASAAVTQLVVAQLSGEVYPTVGASGGVFGLLLAFALYFPTARVMLLIPPIPMPARVFALLYAAIELVLGVTGSQEGVAHFAHLGGMAGGYLMLRWWRTPAGLPRER
jgi:membrane associated rhomboid family serine protease